MSEKQFKEAGNTAVFTTTYVMIEKKVITYVTHDEEDGAWQFFSDDRFASFEEVAMVVGLEEIVALDHTILQLADMAEGYSAHRNFRGDEWKIQKD